MSPSPRPAILDPAGPIPALPAADRLARRGNSHDQTPSIEVELADDELVDGQKDSEYGCCAHDRVLGEGRKHPESGTLVLRINSSPQDRRPQHSAPRFGLDLSSAASTNGAGEPNKRARFGMTAAPVWRCVYVNSQWLVSPKLHGCRWRAVLEFGLLWTCGAVARGEASGTEVQQEVRALGASLRSCPDLDGDGIPEILVGAPSSQFGDGDAARRRGAVLIASGKDLSILSTLWGPENSRSFGAALDMYQPADRGEEGGGSILIGDPSGCDGRGCVFDWETLEDEPRKLLECPVDGQQFGQTVVLYSSRVDGSVDRVAVGAPADQLKPSTSARGAVYVFSLPGGALLYDVAGWARDSGFGSVVTVLGDVDQDGWADFAVGAPEATKEPGPGGATVEDGIRAIRPGALHVFSGATGARLSVTYGAMEGEEFGTAIAAVQLPVDPTKIQVWVGAPGFQRVVRRKSVQLGRVVVCDIAVDGRLEKVETLEGVESKVGGHSRFGESLCAVADFDGDAVSEFAVGAPSAFDGVGDAGVVYIVSGSEVRIVRDYRWDGDEHKLPPFGFGSALAACHDFDGDGLGDLAIGAPSDSGGFQVVGGGRSVVLGFVQPPLE